MRGCGTAVLSQWLVLAFGEATSGPCDSMIPQPKEHTYCFLQDLEWTQLSSWAQ